MQHFNSNWSYSSKFPFKSFSERCHWLGISDHLIFCTRKISRLKTGVIHKYLNFRLFKNYTVNSYKDALKQLGFPNCEILDGVNDGAHSNFSQKIITAIDKIAPHRSKRIKENTQKWFYSEVLEKLKARDKLFKKFKISRLTIDKELYKKAKYDASKLIITKKQAFSKEKLSETIGKPEELREYFNSWHPFNFKNFQKFLFSCHL